MAIKKRWDLGSVRSYVTMSITSSASTVKHRPLAFSTGVTKVE
jgi:hypothetical protein